METSHEHFRQVSPMLICGYLAWLKDASQYPWIGLLLPSCLGG